MSEQPPRSSDNVKVTIGVIARQCRKSIGWTQEDVAEQIGVSSEFYARIERGNALPSVNTLCLLADCLRVDVDVLIGLRRPEVSIPQQRDRVRSFEIDSRDWRKLVRRLRRASPQTRRLIKYLLRSIERHRQEDEPA